MARSVDPVVLYEAPSRVRATIADLLRVCGPDRWVAVCRELSKLYEETWRGALADAEGSPPVVAARGEYVLVVDRATEQVAGPGALTEAIGKLADAGLRRRDAAAATEVLLGVTHRAAYDAALAHPGFARGVTLRSQSALRRCRVTDSRSVRAEQRVLRGGRYGESMAEHYFQTTPLYYVNDRPHVGTAYSEIVSDALARWHRLIGDDVFFLTGTDEHGMKLARSAAEHDSTPQAWVDAAQQWFRDAWAALGISNDDFIRTTQPRHVASASAFAEAIYERGFIYKGEYAGWYCVSCENYYLEADLLPGNRCPIHEVPIEWVTEENYFFALSRFADSLTEWYRDNPGNVVPESRRNEALGIIRGGLEDFSISRTSFDWGIPVPWDTEHVFYVWFEALMNYTTAIGYGTDPERFAAWWPSVRHLIGKDIVRFHAVWWPAMCIAAGIAPPRTILAHGYLLMGGKKMSKSLTNQVDPLELFADVGLDADRLYQLRDLPLGADGDFSYEGLLGRYNADLANNLGNLLQRVSTLVGQKCGGIGPAAAVRVTVSRGPRG